MNYDESVVLIKQRQINKLNFTKTLVEDGAWGPKTAHAVARFDFMFGEINLVDAINVKKNAMYDNVKGNKVPYLSQRTSYKYSSRMCSIASILMVTNFLQNTITPIKPEDIEEMDKMIDGDNKFLLWAKKRKLDNFILSGKLEQISKILAKVINRYTDEYEYTLKYQTIEDIKKSIANDKAPIVVSVKFPGRKYNKKRSGHYIVIIGYMGDGNFIINDPWGYWGNDYKKTDDIMTKGKGVVIRQDELFGEWGVKTEVDDRLRKPSKNRHRVISISK